MTFDERLNRIVEALCDASEHFAKRARTTPHTMHVDDHRRKSESLALSAAAVERQRRNLAAPASSGRGPE